jgi:hypothetical protein
VPISSLNFALKPSHRTGTKNCAGKPQAAKFHGLSMRERRLLFGQQLTQLRLINRAIDMVANAHEIDLIIIAELSARGSTFTSNLSLTAANPMKSPHV